MVVDVFFLRGGGGRGLWMFVGGFLGGRGWLRVFVGGFLGGCGWLWVVVGNCIL